MTATTKRAPARTPQQIAQDKVDKAQAKVDALNERGARLSLEASEAYVDLAAAEKKLAFLKTDPDLGGDPAQTSIDDELDDEALPRSGDA